MRVYNKKAFLKQLKKSIEIFKEIDDLFEERSYMLFICE